ncbi:MAG: 30S ribosomal protein S3 [Candidatus Bathyarchaeota archaeon]|nr:30S ribosomal protein S3 [Candidatus Bathyarchaeota archaeon]
MSVVKHFIEDSIKKAEIEEFLQNEFERAGYGGVSITKTPLGTHLVVYTMRPGLVIGRGGETIRALAKILEEKFNLPSPQISVAEIEIPELNAYVVASRIASALKRGVHYRRAGFWGLTQAMEAGALGIEIIISGKLRTDRARYEKFREGYLPKSGEPPRRYMRTAELHVHLKPGTLGVKVSLLPPDAQFPDKVEVHIIEEDLEKAPERKFVAKEPEAPTEPVAEPETAPVPEPAVEVAPEPVAEKEPVTETPATEPEIIVVDDTVEPEKKEVAPVTEPKVEEKKPAAKKKVEKKEAEKKVVEEKAAEPKEAPAKKAKAAKKKVAEPEAAPAKEKKEAKKKVTKTVTEPKAPSVEENKEAEE